MALRRLTVATQQPYEVVLGTGALAELPSMVAANVERIALIHAPHMSELAAQIAAQFPDKQVLTIAAPDGENAKTIGFVIDAWDQLGAAGFTRSDLVIGIGFIMGDSTTPAAWKANVAAQPRMWPAISRHLGCVVFHSLPFQPRSSRWWTLQSAGRPASTWLPGKT